ncbi:S9 family peptidase [uncultured Martelella sp.]|uniref:S9 family peptidase n=1 Tax=uncultured Martelella sp. TaxID=392331 RepID=UPI0029C8F48A|nr:S9 family peptidase [uncultured Martelella sp.]
MTSPSISALLSIPEKSAPAVSTDGSLIAFLSNETGIAQIWLMPAENGRPTGPARQVTDLDERVVSMAFSPKGRDLLFVTDCGMDERFRLFLLKNAEGEPIALTHAPGRVHAWGCWSPDGASIAYGCNGRNAAKMDIHVMDIATGKSRIVMENHGYAEPVAFSPDGKRLLVNDSRRSMSDQDLVWVDLATLAVTPALPHAGRARYLSVKFLDDDAQRTVILTDQDNDFLRPCIADFKTAALSPVFAPDGVDVDIAALSSDKTTLACTVNHEGIDRIELITLADGSIRHFGAPGTGQIGGLKFTEGDTALLFSLAGPAFPSDNWRLALESGQFTRLAEPDSATGDYDFTEPVVERLASFDGLSVPYFRYTPNQAPPAGGWPVLFMVHGGPENQWKAQFRADLQYYLKQGIMVIAPNVRGSTGYGRRYHQMDDREKRMDSVRDLLALRDAIAARPDVDASRIGVMGQSYGGFMVLAAMTEAPQAWRCGIDFYGISNFTTLMMTTGPWRMQLRAAEYGDPVEDAALLADISPMTRIERINAPLLLVHANCDPRVPIEQSEQVYSVLKGHDRPVEYLRIDHEGHGFSRTANRIQVFSAVSAFLQKHLIT